MNDTDEDCYSSGQSATTPVAVSSVSKDSAIRPHGEKLKMMNPTPNGCLSNHKIKPDGQDSVKKHSDSSKSSDHHHKHSDSGKHSSDHVKRKESSDGTKHKSSSTSHSKPKDINSKDNSLNNDSSKVKDHHSKEKKHSSSKEGVHSKDGKHLEHSSIKKEHTKSYDKSKKEHKHSSSEPKLDNFKENEKVKEDKNKESKDKVKEKHKEKHKDSKVSDHSKDKSEKSDEKHKEKHSDKIKEKHGDKIKEKHGDKIKEKHGEKIKEKHEDKIKEKHEDKVKEKHDDKIKEKHADKVKEKHADKTKEKHSDKSKDKHSDKTKEKTSDKPKEKIRSHDSEKVKFVSPEKPKEPSVSPKKIKEETVSEDEMPLAVRKPKVNKSIKREQEESDDEPLAFRAEKVKKVKVEKPIKKRKPDSDDENHDYDDYKKPAKKVKKEKPKIKTEPETGSPKKKVKKDDDQDVWKWWEEEKLDEGKKWRTLEHNGPVFAPPYERVPKNVKFYYDGKPMELSEVTEEVAGFYGRMLDHEYTSKESFNKNFFKDWRKVMTPKEREIITDLKKCNFKDFDVYYKMKSEERKSMTKEQKLEIKKQNEELTQKYGYCIIDGHKQKIGNFKIEPPGLFRGRGEHPKMGMLKRRVEAEDIMINLSKGAKVPEPPPGHKWKEVRHDSAVTWLASWSENILGSTKYIMLNPSSKLKGEKDWQKYETARKLKNHADRIRRTYTEDFKSKEMKVRQRAVALYFIDKLALRAGNEKDEDTADTVGCCSLRVEHITLDDEKDGQEYVVSFDFLGKDSIRYENSVAVEKRAYKNLKLFMENKQPGDDLFDRLNTAILNKYLNELMDGLTAKVFRTYNASKTLQEQLDLLTKEEMSIPEKILAYNRANRAVAVLCNHQRAVPKGFSKSMENLKTKMDEKVKQIKEFKKDMKDLKQAAKHSAKEKMIYDKRKKRLQTLEEQLKKLEVQATDREENKQIALGTSKLNYLDPRISVAWCKKWDVPIEKIYNRTQRDKFRWAIEMAGPEYKF